ncbi:hypothetical protein Gohar_016362, partial [Gossypium harknessii]|nr:hypothetical protein [Gossypium harknessii]
MEKAISDSVLLASEILLLSCFYLQSGTALDTITPSKSIKDPEFIISHSGVFRLGFFSFANSSNPSSLWESFEDPSNAFLETMKIRTDVKKGRKVELKSWKSIDDPSDGSFSFGFEPFNIPELVIRNNNKLYFRSGPWNGNTFIGVIMKTVYIDGFHVVADNQQQTYYFTYEYSDNYRLKYYELDSQGKLFERTWDGGKGDWINRYSTTLTESCVYGQCGPFGICDRTKQPICSCLKGFKPRNIEEWSR